MNLTNKRIRNTFKSVLSINQDGLEDTLATVTDGVGEETPIQISRNEVKITNLTVEGNLIGNLVNQVDNVLEASGNIEIDFSLANIHTFVLSDDVNFTLTNPIEGSTYTVVVKQSAQGGKSVTWPTILWQGGIIPVQTTTSDKTDIYTLTWLGSSWFGSSQQNFG